MNASRTGRALVLGLGASGRAAVRLLRRQGWQVAVADEKADPAVLAELGRPDLLRVLDPADAASFDRAVVSPGIPAEHPWLAALQRAGVPVIPEFELGLAALPGVRVAAVTGTNGKSSLVKWMAEAWTAAGVPALPAGNYGLPPSEIALSDNPPRALVLELSSFQLEQAVDFRPDAALLLNLSPNHLDRHPGMEAYAAAKARMFRHMARSGTAIVHRPAWAAIQPYLPVGLHPVWFDEHEPEGYGYAGGWVTRRGEPLVDLRGTWWDRLPLGVNAAAGVAALEALGATRKAMEETARAFVPLAHRMERVAEIRGVVYINDSKASTMSALAAALASGPEKKHLIAGGILKERDVNFVKETLAKHAVFVYCIGQAAQKLVSAWNDVVPCVDAGTLETAVQAASRRARPGDVVLLSPGCSSFDQFTSYAQRGEVFKQTVRACTG